MHQLCREDLCIRNISCICPIQTLVRMLPFLQIIPIQILLRIPFPFLWIVVVYNKDLYILSCGGSRECDI